MIIAKPFPWQEAIRKLNQKVLTPATLNSAEWKRVPVAIRERAFFSATIESGRFLQDAKDTLQDFLLSSRETLPNGKVALKAGSRARFVKLMREKAKAWGMAPLDPKKKGTIQDITTEGRLRLIFETQTKQAHEFAWWQDGMDPMTLQMFPAMRFYRQRPVKDPRPYHEENRGVVKRKDDLPFWVSMNRDFQVPWAPWGFNSGMDTEEVDREEAEALGLVQPGEILDSPQKDFNDHTKASLNGLDEGTQQWLRKALGDLARFDLDAVWLKPGIPVPGSQKKPQAKPLPQENQKPAGSAEEIRKKILGMDAKKLNAKKKRIQDLHDEWHRINREKKYAATSRKREISTRQSEIYRLLVTLENELIDQDLVPFHVALSVPKDSRAGVAGIYAGKLTAATKQSCTRAFEFLSRMVHKERLTSVPFRVRSITSRAFYRASDKTARVPHNQKSLPMYAASTSVHEIMHHLERFHPELISRAKTFLKSRRRIQNGQPETWQRLKHLEPRSNYEYDEITIEDSWKEKGGSSYTGKIYDRQSRAGNIDNVEATEIFTMGIERIYEDPFNFAQQDPEFFNFILGALQNIPDGTPGG